jgi:hypothetical protein
MPSSQCNCWIKLQVRVYGSRGSSLLLHFLLQTLNSQFFNYEFALKTELLFYKERRASEISRKSLI